MKMCKYEPFLTKWKEILQKVTDFGGNAKELIIESCATKEEIEEKEKSLGFALPSSFKEILMYFSRHAEFRWSLPENANLPDVFREIFSGEIGWNIDWIEDLTAFGSQIEAYDGIDSALKNKLKFFNVRNGDLLAFDMESSQTEPNVVYWSHEGEGVLFLAESFLSYLSKLTDLYGIGSEIWQMEPFMEEYGLNSNGENANKWKYWFDTFAALSIEDAERDLESLIQYIEYHRTLEKRELNALEAYNKNDVFQTVMARLQRVDESQKEILIRVIGESVGPFASHWVKSLWKEETKIKPEHRSYLTSRCFPVEEGLSKVTAYVENLFVEKISSYKAKKHLCWFRNDKILEWIKGYISSTTTKEEWYDLFACSNPSWDDIEEWFLLGEKYRRIAINALEYMVDSWNSTYIKGNYKICNPPEKKQVLCFLEKEKEKETLNIKKRIFEKIIQNIDFIL